MIINKNSRFYILKLAICYWPTAIGMIIMWVIAVLFPFKWQMIFGKMVGFLIMILAKDRKNIVIVNLKLCFPLISDLELKKLLKAHFYAIGMGIIETAIAWWTPDHKIKKLVTVIGIENLNKALQQGTGVILLTGHFTTMELGVRIITWYQKINIVYRQNKNMLFEYITQKICIFRTKNSPLPRTNIRKLIRCLKNGNIIWYAPDQDQGIKSGLFIPFFGISTRTITATPRLALLSGAVVIPYFPKRLPNYQGYEITIQPALDMFPSNNIEYDIERINKILENHIRTVPEQYFWIHRRFKTRPLGLPNPYI